MKKTELANYQVDGKAIFVDYELTGLFIGGLLDFTNNTTHDLWLKDNEKIIKLVDKSLKGLDDLNLSGEIKVVEKKQDDDVKEVEDVSAQEAIQIEGDPAQEAIAIEVKTSDQKEPIEKIKEKSSIEETLEVVPLVTETGSSLSRSASIDSNLSGDCKLIAFKMKF